MDRLTKLVVVVWALATLAAALWMLYPAFVGLIQFTCFAFVAAAALTAARRRMVGLVLAFAYVYPVIIVLVSGRYHRDFDVVWMGALLGAIIPDALRMPWQIPSRWRPGLALWALIIASAASIVIAREWDFNARILEENLMSSASGGGGPGFLTRWILSVALSQIIGILWFDWLCGARLDFQRDVATPLILSVMGLASVSIYQLFVDASFLGSTVFIELGRATGTLFDANPTGMVAALWTAGAMIWSAGLPPLWRRPAMVLTLSSTWLAVWATGSRTAFVAAAIATAAGVHSLSGGAIAQTWRRRPRLAAAASAVFAGMVLLLAYASPEIVGPLRRLWDTLPSPSIESARAFIWELWDRNRYGTVAAAMIRDFPLFGIGIGCFHVMVADYAGLVPLMADNAQNWYRHQFTELGAVGSLGWIAFVASFGLFALRRRAAERRDASIVRGAILAFAAISLVGMPSQHPVVSFTFWTFAFWYLSIVGAPDSGPVSSRSWAVVLAICVIFAAGTAYYATTQLRVAARAQRVGFPYSYGFYFAEPDAEGGEYRWARQRAVTVVEATGQVLNLSVWVNHVDIATNPVDVKVWRDGDLVIDTTLKNGSRVQRAVLLPSHEKRVVLDTWVSRVIRPADFGVGDSRELGLMVKWEFDSQLPAGVQLQTQ